MLRTLTGDCRKILSELESDSVQCCVTSPPYWGLRDYGCGMVALELGRKAILIELNPDYVELIKQRCNVTPGLALM